MYTKMFKQMYEGTLATKGPWQALVTFQQMLILGYPNGVVDMTAEAISRFSTVPLEIIQIGITALEQPDPGSRSEECGGRRIVRIDEHRDWGWHIVNFIHYRNLQDEQARQDYQNAWARKKREQAKIGGDKQGQTGTGDDKKGHSKSKSKKETPTASYATAFDAEAMAWRNLSDGMIAAWRRAYPAVHVATELQRAAVWLKANPKNRKSNYDRFLTNWLSRAQDKAPRVAADAPRAPSTKVAL